MTFLPMRTSRLVIRNWHDGDRDIFHEINSDPEVMAYFPKGRTRAESDDLMDRLVTQIAETGFGFFAMESRQTGECLGFAGLAKVRMEPVFPRGTVEIGWRLARRHWGSGYASEAAQALLAYGFAARALAEIIAFAVETNQRSIAVMQRIGMERDPTRDFDHPAIPEDRPDLRRHVVYAIRQDAWSAQPG